jgi:hypothetical protein
MQMDLPVFRREPATHIVSLGMRCVVAHNLRRFYDFSTAYPFDWWVTPAPGLIALLNDPDISALYDPTQLSLLEGGKSVCHANGIRLFHEFERDKSQKGKPVLPGWQEALAAPKERTAALMQRLLDLNAPGNRIAFFRQPDRRVRAVRAALDARFPLAEWTLVPLAPIEKDAALEKEWRGDPNAWDRVLGDLDLRFDRGRHRPHADSVSPREDRSVDALVAR